MVEVNGATILGISIISFIAGMTLIAIIVGRFLDK